MDPKILIIIMMCGTAGILSVYFVLNMRKNPEKNYLRRLKEIMGIYKEILVKIDTIPDLKDRTVIKVEKIEDLISIQQEIRKPIYYYQNVGCTDFILISKDEVCVFSLKSSTKLISPVDVYEEKKDNTSIKKKDNSILDDIDKTTIIKVDDGSVYKVSPLRVNKKKGNDFVSSSKKSVPKKKNNNIDIDLPKSK